MPVFVFSTDFYVEGTSEEDARAELTKLLREELDRDDLTDLFDLVEIVEEEETTNGD